MPSLHGNDEKPGIQWRSPIRLKSKQRQKKGIWPPKRITASLDGAAGGGTDGAEAEHGCEADPRRTRRPRPAGTATSTKDWYNYGDHSKRVGRISLTDARGYRRARATGGLRMGKWFCCDCALCVKAANADPLCGAAAALILFQLHRAGIRSRLAV